MDHAEARLQGRDSLARRELNYFRLNALKSKRIVQEPPRILLSNTYCYNYIAGTIYAGTA